MVPALKKFHMYPPYYRLCKVPSTGKKDLTEECFGKNILKFANDTTYWRDSKTSWKPGTAHDLPG